MIHKPPGPHLNTCNKWITIYTTQFAVLTPFENFLFALKAKESKRQYPNRLDKFLTFMELQGTIEEKCVELYEFSKNNLEILQSYIIRFINLQKERIENIKIQNKNSKQKRYL